MTFELGWVERDLRALDRSVDDASRGELCIGTLFQDERPPPGVLSLCDFRLGGRLSHLCLSGFITGTTGEKVLLPVRVKFPFEKVLVVGLGPRAQFDEAAYRAAVGWILDAVEGLCVRRVAVDLPGRHAGAIDAPRAVELFDEAVAARAASQRLLLDGAAIIDDRDAQRAVENLRIRPGRRNLAARR